MQLLSAPDQSIEGVLVHASCCAPKQSGSPGLTSPSLHVTTLRTTLKTCFISTLHRYTCHLSPYSAGAEMGALLRKQNTHTFLSRS